VQIEVRAVAGKRGGLDTGRFAALKPQLASLGDGDGLVVGDVDAGGLIDRDLGVMSVGVLLARERLELAVRTGAGNNDPGLLLLAGAGLPEALADGHDTLLLYRNC
jgi:hypothetical protein